MSIDAITARIASIEQRFRAEAPSPASSEASPQSADAGSFADVLEATGSTGAPVGSPLGGSPLGALGGAALGDVAVPWSRLGVAGPSLLATPAYAGAPHLGGATAPVGVGAGPTQLEALDGRAVAPGTPYAELFDAAGARHGVPPRLLASIGWVESRYDPRALSPDGAQGVMQLMPFISEAYGADPHDPAQAIDAAARLLAGHHERFGAWVPSVASYFSGAGAVSRAGGVPPTDRSRTYVRSVTERLAHV